MATPRPPLMPPRVPPDTRLHPPGIHRTDGHTSPGCPHGYPHVIHIANFRASLWRLRIPGHLAALARNVMRARASGQQQPAAGRSRHVHADGCTLLRARARANGPRGARAWKVADRCSTSLLAARPECLGSRLRLVQPADQRKPGAHRRAAVCGPSSAGIREPPPRVRSSARVSPTAQNLDPLGLPARDRASTGLFAHSPPRPGLDTEDSRRYCVLRAEVGDGRTGLGPRP